MAKKLIRFVLSIFIIFLSIIGLFMIFLLCSREYIPVDYVASYDVNIDVDANEFDAYSTVRDIKNELETNKFFQNYGEMDGLYELLCEYDDDTRVVISFGSRIQYFWLPKGDYDGFIKVKYQSDQSKNKIYIHTVDYNGSMIDIASY